MDERRDSQTDCNVWLKSGIQKGDATASVFSQNLSSFHLCATHLSLVTGWVSLACCLLRWCCFVWFSFPGRRHSQVAQDDLCILCTHGVSTRAKKEGHHSETASPPSLCGGEVRDCETARSTITPALSFISLTVATSISVTAKFSEQLRWAALMAMDCPFVWRVRADLSPVVFQSHAI